MQAQIAAGADRRTHGRHPIYLEVILNFADGSRRVARSVDLGKGGMGLVADVNPPIGSWFTIKALLPVRPRGGAIFEAEARVVNSIYKSQDGGFRIGVQFVKLNAAAQDVLDRCLP